jgi:hypothetical protein
MKSKFLFWLLATAILISAPAAHAQQAGKIFRIGFLDPSTASSMAAQLEAFRQELRKLGWIEGKNISIEYRYAEGKLDRYPELAADLVRLKVDLIVVSGGATPLAAKKATSNYSHRDDEHWRSCESRSGCQSGAPGRQCHRELEFIARAKYQKARDTQGRSPQARPGWTSVGGGRQRIIRPPT